METVRRTVEDVSPVAAFDALDADVLLENGERGWDSTYVAGEPVETFVHRREDAERGCFERLGDWLDGLPDTDGSTAAGAYGFVGYDVAKRYEDVPDGTERDIDVPDGWFGFYDTVAVLDDDAYVEAVGHTEEESPPDERAARIADEVEDATYDERTVSGTNRRSNFDRDAYLDAVRRVKERIREGETFQTNISQRLSFDSDGSALDLYARLRETNPSPYMGLIDGDGWSVVCSSPELLVRVRDEDVVTRPIAGTRRRGEDAADELTASDKERAEHSILLDLARNDVGKVSRYGTVEVDEFATVVPYPEVYHLESVVTGEKSDGTTAVDALRAVFPGGTVTGAPKPRTLRIIEEVEPTERGPYTGSMGRVTLDGDCTFNILIRTAVRDGKTYHIQVGGGVVHDSVPQDEYDETLDKARGVLNAVEDGENG
ncbi:anthranilate synthase component I family protein [Haladaptatus sp. F3-133]|uniref:anthranilate synthase n=1 Tax=Halorutilus salinus TaxID=2487751 RepID=A0A9Q4C4J6_9EURY|nr:anthranilate synthase component I family protein [Halorutilus salinus]MCX2819333.1 anthranilate synthase component I family protein [Halorutilus salinus]